MLMLAIGITPDYIITKIKLRNQLRQEEVEFEDDYDKKKYEALRQKELERARKKRQRELEAARREEIRRQAEA